MVGMGKNQVIDLLRRLEPVTQVPQASTIPTELNSAPSSRKATIIITQHNIISKIYEINISILDQYFYIESIFLY